MMHLLLIFWAVVQEAIVVAKEDHAHHADSSCAKDGTTPLFSPTDPVGADKRKVASTGDVFIQSPSLKLQQVVGGLAQDDTQDVASTRAMEDMLQREQVAEINMLESQVRQGQAELGLIEQRLGQVERKLVEEETAKIEHPQQILQEQRLPPGLLMQEQMPRGMPGVVQLPPLQAAQIAQGVQIAPLQTAQLSQLPPIAQGQVPQMQGLQAWLQPMMNNVQPQQVQQAAMVAPFQGILPNPAVYAGVR